MNKHKVHNNNNNDSNVEILTKKEEDLFQILVKGVKDYAIFMLDTNGIITSWNEGARRMKGYEENEILGKHFSIFYPAEDVEKNRPFLGLQQAKENSTYEEEGWRVKKNGDPFFAHILITALHREDGTLRGFAKVTRDITKQREVREENRLLHEELKRKVNDVEKSEARLTAIIENAEGMVWSVDKEGRLQFFNHAFIESYKEKMQKLPEEGEIVYDSILAGLGDKEEMIRLHKQALDGEKVVYEMKENFKDCKRSLRVSLNPIFTNDEVVGLSCSALDITDKVTSEQKLADNSKQLQKTVTELEKVLNYSVDMICTIDAEGRFIQLSKASEAMLGFKPEELAGRKFNELLVEEDIERSEKTLQIIMSGVPVTNFENRYYRKDGTTVPLIWSALWSGQEETMFCIARDATEQKRLENEIQHEKERFIDLFLHAPVAICILKGENHVYEMANPLYLQVTGKKDIIGKTVKQVFPEVEVQGILKRLDNVYKTGKSVTLKEGLVRVDVTGTGHLTDIYTNAVYQPYRNRKGDVEGIFFFGIDVTEQVVARKKIEESEKRYRDLIDSLPAAVHTCDAAGKIRVYNKAAVALWGREPDLAKDLYTGAWKTFTTDGTFLPPHCTPVALTLFEKRQITYEGGTIIERLDGHKSHILCHPIPIFDSEGKLTGAINVSIDITALKQAEEKLRISNERFEIVIKATNDAIWDWNIISGEFYWNNGYERLFGYSKLAKPQKFEQWLERIHPDDVARVRKGLFEKINNSDKNFWQDEYRYLKANGETAIVLNRGFIVFDEHNKPVRFVGALQDITNRKKTETEKEHLIDQLTHSNRDLEQFNYITSHNLRGPLSNLIGLLNLLDFDSLSDSNKELLNMFKSSTRQLDQTINDLNQILIIKDSVNLENTRINIDEVFNNVRKYFVVDIETNSVSINTNFACSEVTFNKSYLESILTNLLSNSIKYSSPKRPLKIDISTEKREDCVLLTFSDNGMGIDMKRNKDRIFGLYQRFHSNKKGKGLGLFITKAQLTSLGGNIEVESEVDKGTTFYITFREKK